MSDPNQVNDLLKQLASMGFKASDIMKGMKDLKSQGLLKSGRGKAPSDDPVRNAIKEFILGGAIQVDGKPVNILDAVTNGLGTGEDKASSYLVTLNDKFQINFLVKKPKVKKDKKVGSEKTEEVKKSMEEVAVA